jgi:DNA-binding NtrC family response regulator
LADERVLVFGLHDRVDIVAEMLSAMGMQVQVANSVAEAAQTADQANRRAFLSVRVCLGATGLSSLASILQANRSRY